MSQAAASRPLVLLASARRAGDTHLLASRVLAKVPHQLLDLLDFPVAPYSYNQDYSPADTFQQVVALLLQHQTLVLATPVYWYSMSGLLKTFLDRLTDLITSHKYLGRQLAGKRVFLLASGSDPELPEGFEVPLRRTAAYFDMQFVASFYHAVKQPLPVAQARLFASQLGANQ